MLRPYLQDYLTTHTRVEFLFLYLRFGGVGFVKVLFQQWDEVNRKSQQHSELPRADCEIQDTGPVDDRMKKTS